MTIIAVVSGGLDSTVLAYKCVSEDPDTRLLSVDYGQRHVREIESAKEVAKRLNLPHTIVDLTPLREVLHGSTLTDNIPPPEGHYAGENMAATVVPNRNAIFLAVAFGMAVAEQADRVCIGVHAGDHPIYPDCRSAFIQAFSQMESLATEGYGHPNLHLEAPFIHMTKAQIVNQGFILGVPFFLTWSCYNGGEMHCGRCGTCVERKEAFRIAGVHDPTRYEDAEFEVAAYRG